MSEQNCTTCHYGEKLSCTNRTFCRRYPPRVVASGLLTHDRDGIGSSTHVQIETLTELPEVTADDWCGEWKERDK